MACCFRPVSKISYQKAVHVCPRPGSVTKRLPQNGLRRCWNQDVALTQPICATESKPPARWLEFISLLPSTRSSEPETWAGLVRLYLILLLSLAPVTFADSSLVTKPSQCPSALKDHSFESLIGSAVRRRDRFSAFGPVQCSAIYTFFQAVNRLRPNRLSAGNKIFDHTWPS